MRNFYHVLLAVTALLLSCREEENATPSLQQVEFSLQVASSTHTGGRVDQVFPEGAMLRLSLTDDQGNPVLTNHVIKILRIGEGHITEPLQLRPGIYRLMDFMIADESGEILFATPKYGSKLAPIVQHVLPYGFTISKNKVTNVNMQVVSTLQQVPEDFGYVSFHPQIIHPWSISVMAPVNGKVILTDAQAFLYKDDVLIREYALQPKVNLLGFTGDVNETYTLVIQKSGFDDYEMPFHYKDLQEVHGSNPVSVLLVPTGVPALVIQHSDQFLSFWVHFNQEGGIVIDWGDGATEEINFYEFTEEEFRYAYRDHEYTTSGTHTVRITGSLDQVTGFDFSDLHASMFNASSLPSLKSISFYASQIPLLDLSENTKLQQLGLTDVTINNLMMPASHDLNNIFIEAIGNEQAEKIIASVYHNAVAKNIHNGSLSIDQLIVDELSDEAKDMLETLKNDYGWFGIA